MDNGEEDEEIMEDDLKELGLEFPDMGLVSIEVEDFKTRALPIYAFPFPRVLEITNQEPGPHLMGEMVDLFKLAMENPARADELESLSYDQVANLLNQWMFKSSPAGTGEGRASIRIVNLDSGEEDGDDIPEEVQAVAMRIKEMLESRLEKRSRPWWKKMFGIG